MLFAFLSIVTFKKPYNIPQAKDEKIKSFVFLRFSCSVLMQCCYLRSKFSKDHVKFALEINTLSCGYQIWCFFFCFTLYSLCSFSTGGNLFSWFVRKDYKETNEHKQTQTYNLGETVQHLCMWKMWRKKNEVIPTQSNHLQWLDET